MADRTAGGKATGDARALIIRQRRLTHEINAMINTIDKLEIDILEAEQGIERTRETIIATGGRADEKREELKSLSGNDTVMETQHG